MGQETVTIPENVEIDVDHDREIGEVTLSWVDKVVRFLDADGDFIELPQDADRQIIDQGNHAEVKFNEVDIVAASYPPSKGVGICWHEENEYDVVWNFQRMDIVEK